MSMRNTNERYVYVSGNGHNFTVPLNGPLVVDSSWRVAVVEIIWENNFSSVPADVCMFIETSCVEYTSCNNRLRPILFTIPITNQERKSTSTTNHRYIKLKQTTLLDLTIDIKGDNWQNLTEYQGPTSLLLHFKQF